MRSTSASRGTSWQAPPQCSNWASSPTNYTTGWAPLIKSELDILPSHSAEGDTLARNQSHNYTTSGFASTGIRSGVDAPGLSGLDWSKGCRRGPTPSDFAVLGSLRAPSTQTLLGRSKLAAVSTSSKVVSLLFCLGKLCAVGTSRERSRSSRPDAWRPIGS